LEGFIHTVRHIPGQMTRTTRRLGHNRAIYTFSPKNRPAYKVRDGERVVIETMDCFSGRIKSPKTLFEDVPMEIVNPATGPIEVEGMRAGDTVCVHIEKVKLGAMGVTVCSRGLGNLSKSVRTKVMRISGEEAAYSDELDIRLNPHIGVIGVSPAKGEYPTFYPGDHGGNLDTVEVREGSKVYIPTFVDGANVALGDVHAAMGDGEVCGTGLETSAELTVRLSKAEGMEICRPMIETPTEWLTYAASKTLDEASRLATGDMVSFIQNRRGVDFEDAYMLASLVANLRISQVVDPLMAARMSISKRYL
jgi:amidase